MNKKNLYWICQIGGWAFFVLLNSLFLQLNNAFNTTIALGHLSMFLLGISISHVYRTLIVRAGWLKLKILPLIPRVVVSTVVFAACIEYLQYLVESQLQIEGNKHENAVSTIINILNFSFVLFFWSLIYFLVHYIENYKKAEIENLKWSASINEIELNKLKSQLNPHFMFNAMNSIRALVDENPGKSKEAITQLSNILRNTLQMGKNKVIPFDEELRIINDYLALESIRYEERLKVSLDIHPDSKQFQVPPLMIQTLVENAIKHGISKLTKGGIIEIQTKIEKEQLIIKIKNSGQLQSTNESDSGFGIKNTLQRLQLLYGKDANMSIRNLDNEFVLTELIIPKNVLSYESNHH